MCLRSGCIVLAFGVARFGRGGSWYDKWERKLNPCIHYSECGLGYDWTVADDRDMPVFAGMWLHGHWLRVDGP